MAKLKVITYKDIKDLEPCYDPIKYIPEDWKGTIIDILNLKDVPHNDKLWCVLRPELISHKTMRLFAVWCAREALKLIDNPDPRSIEGVLVAERFAKGDATLDELRLARAASYCASTNAAAAAWRAACYADAAANTLYYVAYAAYYATDAITNAATDVAAYGAANAAMKAAANDTATYAAQIHKLIEMIKEEGNIHD